MHKCHTHRALDRDTMRARANHARALLFALSDRRFKCDLLGNASGGCRGPVICHVATGPPGCAVHFWEYSADWGGCIRAGSVFLGQRDPSTGYLGWRMASGAAITRVSRRAGPKMTPIARLPRFAPSPAGAAMLNTPVFARSKRGYVGTGRGAPIFLCMTQAKLCKIIGHHAPDTQIGGDMRRDTGSGAPPGIATRVAKL